VEHAPSLPCLKIVLLVDDEDGSRTATRWFLAQLGYTVDSVRNAEEALAVFDAAVHDLIVVHNSMPGISGVEMAHVVKLRSPATPVIMFTGLPLENQSCLDAVLHKPTHLLFLTEAIDQIVAARQA
jgi:CheY-like chemotaxis protein